MAWPGFDFCGLLVVGGVTIGFWDRIPLGKAIEGVRVPDSAC